MPHLNRRWPSVGALVLLGAVGLATLSLTPAHGAEPVVKPGDIIVASFGNIIDSPLDRIDPNTGERTRIANNGLLNRPHFLATDTAANLYVANLGDENIIRIGAATGQQTLLTNAAANLHPKDLAMSSSNTLLIASQTATSTEIIDLNPITRATKLVTANGLLSHEVSGIAVEFDGDIVIADQGNRQIVRVDASTHEQRQLATFASGNRLGAITTTDDGTILVRSNLPSGGAAVVKVDPLTGLKSIARISSNSSISSGMARGKDGFVFSTDRFFDKDSRVILSSPPYNLETRLDLAGEFDSMDVVVAGVKPAPAAPNPVAKPDTFTLERPADQLVDSTTVLKNDVDPLGEPLTAERLTDVRNGFTSFNKDGSFFYFPNSGFTGDDTLTYRVHAGNRVSAPTTITFHVLPPQAPVAKDDFFSTPFQKTITFEPANGPLFNDSDPQGDPVSARVITPPKHGLANFDTDNTMTYQPASNFSGTDSFTYQLTDGKHKSNIATVTMTVGNPPPANTAPNITLVKGGSINLAGTSATANVTISDTQTGANNLGLKAASSNQTLLPNSAITFGGTANGRTVTVTPKSGISGTSIVTLTVTDGGGLTKTTTITVKAGDNAGQTITGTAGTDMLFGLGGTDTLDGGGGIDLVAGGDGDDTMTGGPAADLFRGGAGTNKVTDLNQAEGDSSI